MIPETFRPFWFLRTCYLNDNTSCNKLCIHTYKKKKKKMFFWLNEHFCEWENFKGTDGDSLILTKQYLPNTESTLHNILLFLTQPLPWADHGVVFCHPFSARQLPFNASITLQGSFKVRQKAKKEVEIHYLPSYLHTLPSPITCSFYRLHLRRHFHTNIHRLKDAI